MSETTSLGAALAAASTVGLWSIKDHEASTATESEQPQNVSIFKPEMSEETRNSKFLGILHQFWHFLDSWMMEKLENSK